MRKAEKWESAKRLASCNDVIGHLPHVGIAHDVAFNPEPRHEVDTLDRTARIMILRPLGQISGFVRQTDDLW
jgi:hypothetical protein